MISTINAMYECEFTDFNNESPTEEIKMTVDEEKDMKIANKIFIPEVCE